MKIAKSYMDEYAKNKGLISHQIDSYNDFIQRRLQKTINEIGKIIIELPTGEELIIRLGKVSIERAQINEADGSVRAILPHEARLRNLTYSTPIFVEMTPVFEEREHDTEVVEIGEIPIMVKSILCPLSRMTDEELIEAGEDPYDLGGYFIVNGTERVIVLSEEIAPNKLILQKKGEEITSRINCEKSGYVQRHVFERSPEGIITAKFANLVKTPIPIIVLMKALGLETDKEVIESIGTKEEDIEDIYINIYDTQIANRDDALDYIGKKMKVRQKEQRADRATQLLDNYLLAHLGNKPEDRIAKAKYLGIVMRKLVLLHKGKLKEEDIDHYTNKRVKMSGDLLEILFRSIIMGRWGLIARLQYNYQKMMKRGRKLLKLQSVVVSDVLTKQIMRAMATGNWVGGKTGVCQRLERSNFVRTISHLRSVISPLSSTQEHFEARELHSTQWGRLCAVRTPEGQSIGLRNFLALGAQITIPASEADETKIISTLKSLGAEIEVRK
ncbi:MAG: DNA-directed RNA polymerase subunit B'' [archaeon]